MDNARSFHGWTADHGALLKRATARVKVMLLAFALAVRAASTETAVAFTVKTDSSWLATNVAPAATWNTDPSFNTTGWINATVNIPACASGADCIWYDGQFSATRFVWLRKTFTLSNPVSTAVLLGGILVAGSDNPVKHDAWSGTRRWISSVDSKIGGVSIGPVCGRASSVAHRPDG